MDDANPIRRRLGDLLTALAAEEVDYDTIRPQDRLDADALRERFGID